MILVILGFSVSKVRYFVEQPQRVLSPSLYPFQRILANQDLVVSADNFSDNISPLSLMSALPEFNKSFNISYMSYTAPKFNISNSTEIQALGLSFNNDVFRNRLNGSEFPYRFGSFFILEANNRTKTFSSAVFINATS